MNTEPVPGNRPCSWAPAFAGARQVATPIFALLLAFPALTAPAAAQSSGAGSDSRYSSNWGTPPSQAEPAGGGDSAAQRLVDELNRLVDRADGNVSANPAWRRAGAAVSVDARYGLRMNVAPAAAPAAAAPQREQNPGDVALQIFGQILAQQAQKQRQESADSAPAPAAAADYSELVATVAVSNAFALELDFAVDARPAGGNSGRLEFGVGQGDGMHGYRLVALSVDAGGSVLELVRVGSRGTTVAERAAAGLDLADGAVHRLTLTRDRAGGMRLLVDGTVVAELADRASNDGFDRVVIADRDGDYTLRRVAAYGVN
jgi:hypothetical protein